MTLPRLPSAPLPRSPSPSHPLSPITDSASRPFSLPPAPRLRPSFRLVIKPRRLRSHKMAERPKKRARILGPASKTSLTSQRDGYRPKPVPERRRRLSLRSGSPARSKALTLCCSPPTSTSAAASTSSSSRPVTRSQTLGKRTVFPFMRLPAELRNMIYRYALHFSGIENHHERAELILSVQKARRKCEADGDCAAKPRMHTPGVMLLNRQLFNEAAWVLDRIPVVFRLSGYDHIKALSDLLAPTLLRRLPAIELILVGANDDTSHPAFHHSILHRIEQFHVYVRQLADALRGGHTVRSLRFSYESRDVQHHLNICAGDSRGCYLYKMFEEMVDQLAVVRGLHSVTFEGVVKIFAEKAGLDKSMITPFEVKVEVKEETEEDIKPAVSNFAKDFEPEFDPDFEDDLEDNFDDDFEDFEDFDDD